MTASPTPEEIAREIGPLVKFGYGLTMRGDWISDVWSRIWFRWYCPYPIITDCRASACIAAGNCGCSNGPSSRPPVSR